MGPVGDAEPVLPAEAHPVAPAAAPAGRVAAPRLSRHVLRLDDGHRVGVAVAGRGVPFVIVHGYTAEGFVYAQSLSRLVSMGFKVIAIDTAGHGATGELRGRGRSMEDYADLLRRVVDHLGIRRAVLAGHSMGGRLVTELAAHQPDRTIALLLLDAIVGDTWDGMVQLFRLVPPTLALTGAALLLDTATTVPVGRPLQAVKLGRLALPTYLRHVRFPWRLLAPAVSILRSGGSRWMLELLGQERVPVIVIHGERDLAVPLQTARDAATRARGVLVVVKGASHSWLLKDPETLPAIVGQLLHRELGDAYRNAIIDAGLDPDVATIADIEDVLYEPDARVLDLSPPLEFDPTDLRRHRPRYRWTYEHG